MKVDLNKLKLIAKKGGICLCAVNTKCPCEDFLTKQKCRCGVYIDNQKKDKSGEWTTGILFGDEYTLESKEKLLRSMKFARYLRLIMRKYNVINLDLALCEIDSLKLKEEAK